MRLSAPRTSRMVIPKTKTAYHVISRTALDGFPLGVVEKYKFDGVVKSPIYFALVLDQTFDVPYVRLQALPNTKSCIWNLFLSHLNTFYEIIKFVKSVNLHAISEICFSFVVNIQVRQI